MKQNGAHSSAARRPTWGSRFNSLLSL